MTIRFVKVASPDPAVQYLVRIITEQITAGRPVLWFISGGSAIGPETQIATLLGSNTTGLEISLTDERPGPVGHADANAKQLRDAGFPLPFHAILDGSGTDNEAQAFDRYLDQALAPDAYRIGLFGMGPDGHTAGIPHASAPAVPGLAAAYAAGHFERISMTPRAIARLDEAVLLAMGEAKRPALEMLGRDEPVVIQSAQALKACGHVVVFNDVKGENE